MRRIILAAVLAITALLAATACSSDTATTTPTAVGTVIDVRTPAEYAAGHLQGAVNIDVSSPNFANEVAGLDKTANYTVYCRSGNRSASATTQLQNLGFTHVTDEGAMTSASEKLNLPIVT